MIDLRCGRYQDVLADVETCDAVICDPPYSERTHAGMRVGDALTGSGNPYVRGGVVYAKWSDDDAVEFVNSWSFRCRGWIVVITDHLLAPVFLNAMDRSGRYAFPPIPFVEMGKQPRLSGDGPASWTCWLAISRPKSSDFMGWGSLPGAYVPPTGCGIQNDRVIKGGKPSWLMRSIIRDYSRPGDLIVDPCAGGATTLISAAIEGRRAIGSEMDETTFKKAQARISAGYTPLIDFDKFTPRPAA